jgi:enterochelin esterase family protein
MVFQDGINHYVNDMAAAVAIDELTQAGEIPVAITLFVNPGEMRSQEYNTPDDKYSNFLLDEIIPSVILSQYNIVDDRDAWAIGGFSSGGIAAITAAWLNTERFSRVLTHNASITLAFERGVDYIDLVGTTPKKDLRIMLHSSPGDIGGTTPGEWFDSNNRMATALETAGYDYRYIIGDDTAVHHPPLVPRQDLPDALRWLWQGCPVN